MIKSFIYIIYQFMRGRVCVCEYFRDNYFGQENEHGKKIAVFRSMRFAHVHIHADIPRSI